MFKVHLFKSFIIMYYSAKPGTNKYFCFLVLPCSNFFPLHLQCELCECQIYKTNLMRFIVFAVGGWNSTEKTLNASIIFPFSFSVYS